MHAGVGAFAPAGSRVHTPPHLRRCGCKQLQGGVAAAALRSSERACERARACARAAKRRAERSGAKRSAERFLPHPLYSIFGHYSIRC